MVLLAKDIGAGQRLVKMQDISNQLLAPAYELGARYENIRVIRVRIF